MPEKPSRTWTIIELIKETQQYFERTGIETARLDSELLLAHCLQKDRVKLYIDFEYPLKADELDAFRSLVRRRAKREPAAYILGFKEFWSLKIKVTPDVLIPRPETELLVEEALKTVRTSGSAGQKKILDIGTGSGAIILALLKEAPDISAYASDISMQALKVAGSNLKSYDFGEKATLICGEGLTPWRAKNTFDLIVSNPPYIPSGLISSLEPELFHEPVKALDGGTDGLDFYRDWIQHMPPMLKNNGWIALEIGDGQGGRISEICHSFGFKNIRIINDYARQERVVLANKIG